MLLGIKKNMETVLLAELFLIKVHQYCNSTRNDTKIFDDSLQL
jgi:hypothetical protein